MTKENLERLKKLLEGTEFDVETSSIDFAFVALKDIWECVEFVEYIGQLSCSFKRGNIYKTISHIDKGIFAIDDENKGNGFYNNRINFKPSTEKAYVNQLKAKAFELYGDIQGGDRFEDWDGNDFKIYGTVFTYSKKYDKLRVDSWIIHEEGKWAKKLTKRIKISGMHISIDDNEAALEKCKSIGQEAIFSYMSKCLEKLLNDEVD